MITPTKRPEKKTIHFLGICGKGMGAIAAALVQEGWRVTGSDENVYPPVSDFLHARGIDILTPYDSRNVPGEVDVVIVGKRVAAGNPELLHVIRRGIAHVSFPRFLSDWHLKESRNAVVAGGVGKTTTTAMLAWILDYAGLKPDYLIGGLPRNLDSPARLSGSAFAVLEGDEYSSCFDDRNPKFLHYNPEVVVVTNIVEDHPDVYRSFGELCDAFAALVESVPQGGCLIVSDRDAAAKKLAAAARCAVFSVGFGAEASARVTGVEMSPATSSFEVLGTQFQVPLCGRMNIVNAAMAVRAARHFEVSPEVAAMALRLFDGVRNRQEAIEAGRHIMIVDKASHPVSLMELAHAMRQRYPGRRLVSVVQPRATGGRAWVYQKNLPLSLSYFDKVIIADAYEHKPPASRPWENEPFCIDMLHSMVAEAKTDVVIARTVAEMMRVIEADVRDGDVVVVTLPEQAALLQKSIEQALASKSYPRPANFAQEANGRHAGPFSAA